MKTELQIIEDEFFAWGFQYVSLRDSYPVVPAFEKTFSTSIGEFRVQFPIYDPSLLKLPKPFLISVPESLSNVRLPHLEGNRSICLFDQATQNIDPLRPKALIAACIAQVKKIIDGWVSGDNRSDIAAEFAHYWEPNRICYLLSENPQCKLYYFERKKIDNTKVTEYIVANNIEEASKWVLKRGGDNSIKSLFEVCSTIRVVSRNPLFIPFNQLWPIETLGGVLSWLRMIDSNAASNLLDKLRKESKKESKFMILINYDSTYVGLRITVTPIGKASLGANLPRKSKPNQKQIFSSLSKRHCISKFERFYINNALESYIFTRNNATFTGLQNKRICIVGCGTVGGYLSQGLVQSGAGTGKGEVCFYDNDTLQPGNLSRHILGTMYLGERKSDALKHYFLQQGLITNVKARGEFSKSDIANGWDLIIDATGNQGFSLLLAKWHSERDKSLRELILVHSWVSGFGHQAKALINDGSSACYACLFDYSQSLSRDRYPSFNPKNEPDVGGLFKRTCGESHLPFGPEASMVAAALAMRLIKQDNPMQINYLQKNISDKAKLYPEKRIRPMRHCPICQK
ncbi:ThiF family adenylyltransferase [Photobacterium leiognathi]|uniref:ThiF family adenylyltransferase n=1 Tax=Photobacterium leiognathi TaxID=553611 RepID=UPI0029822AC6|nr:ThiF family adenylyltransferase [Photobacterium leiognathi]